MRFLNILGYSDLSAGPSQNALAFHRYIQKTTDRSLLIVNGLKPKKRTVNGSDETDDSSVEYHNIFKEQDLIRRQIIDSDIVVIHAIPFPFSGYVSFDDNDRLMFIDMLKFVKSSGKKLLYYEYSHEPSCINRYNFLIDPKYAYAYSFFDGTIAYSKERGIGELYQKNSIVQSSFIEMNSDLNNVISFDFDRNRKKFWKEFSEKTPKTIHFLGRSCPYKGTWLFRDLHWKHFKDAGYISKIEGLIYSIGNLDQLYSKTTAPKVPREDVFLVPTRKDELPKYYDPKFEFQRNMPVYMFPSYVHDEGLERMSRSQFGISLLLFKDKYLQETFENTMLEIVSVGTVPIYRKKWAESFKVNGRSLIEYGSENVGMIFMDENDPIPAMRMMDRLAENEDLYNEFREKCYGFVNKNLGLDAIYGKIVDLIKDSQSSNSKSDNIWSL